MGETATAWDKCDYIFEGRVDGASQEHLYLEKTRAPYAYPAGNGCMKIHSSTQGPTLVQKVTAKMDVPMNRVEVDVTRLVGAFGGKEDQATGVAAPWQPSHHICLTAR